MKRVISAMIVSAMLMGAGSAVHALNIDDYSHQDIAAPSDELKSEEAEKVEWIKENRINLEEAPEFVQGDMKVYTAEAVKQVMPYNFTYMPTYRDIYYWEPTFLFDLVDRDACRAWYEECVKPNIINNTEPQEMYTVSFIKYFKISKEDFEKASEARKLRFEQFRDVNGDDISDEAHEIHNVDIIYTFDNEIINNYYRRNQTNIELTE